MSENLDAWIAANNRRYEKSWGAVRALLEGDREKAEALAVEADLADGEMSRLDREYVEGEG